ncbi:MAG: hypothetical protein KC549_09755 [Myxococcales bacterium]|nr:hypothetical protein [Myxococcales bacterium]
MQPPERPRPTASLAFIYFGIAFTVSAALSMLVLTFVRPYLEGLSRPFLAGFMVAPAIIGVVYGARVAHLGAKHQLPLVQALKRGLGLR